MIDYDFDEGYRHAGYRLVCGLDEAGRGPLAGPVVAGACILSPDIRIEGLDDSKKLTERTRERVYDDITGRAIAWGAGIATPEEIDRINILEASLLAMRRALESCGQIPDILLVDGNQKSGFNIKAEAVVGGDAKSPSIAAASVIAKVTRDRIMREYETIYPGYGFSRHKGYPTRDHKLAVYMRGPTPIHRGSFLSFLERDREWLEREAELRRDAGSSDG